MAEPTVTDADLRELRARAIASGDRLLLSATAHALSGSPSARRVCARIMREVEK
jgi:hypothetical protein